MRLLMQIRQRREIKRAGYAKNQVKTSPEGTLIETATGREICPLSMMPCEIEQHQDGTQITFFERNSNTPLGSATAFAGAPA